MGGYSTYYAPSIYPSSSMPVPTNTFPMTDLHLSYSISYRWSRFYGMGYPIHGISSPGGIVYPHLSNPCHDVFSSQTSASVMMHVQTSMNQVGGGYYHAGKGHGVYQNPSWPAISQN
jgi:hypothetical protein